MRQKTKDMMFREPKVLRGLMLVLLTGVLASCGENFADDFPEGFDPDEVPYIIDAGLTDYTEIMKGENYKLTEKAHVYLSNGKALSSLSSDMQKRVLSGLFFRTLHGDSIVKARVSTLDIYGMDGGTETITAVTEHGEAGRCIVKVCDPDDPPTRIILGRSVITLLEGDRFTATFKMEPGYCQNDKVTWSTSDADVVSVTQNGDVTARAVGTAIITVTSVDAPEVSDSMTVKVLPNWNEMYLGGWRYETIVYASISYYYYNGTRRMVVNEKSTGLSFVAMCGDEYRGIGKPYTFEKDGTFCYIFRIGSNQKIGETITFLGHDASTNRIIEFNQTVAFEDNYVYGTINRLFFMEGREVE